jgi:acetyl-CoA C-acetyltransferase
MGVTAETVAEEFGVSRADQDALAAESHRRAAAVHGGYFTEQITPVEVTGRKGTVTFDTDEHIREGVTVEDLARLRPAFAEEGTVTAGNASGVSDAAAAVVLASEDYAREHDLAPLGRLVAYSHAGVEPRIMGIGPVPAARTVLDRAGLTIDDIDVFEVNEAFAAQALAVIRELGLPPERTKPTAEGLARASGGSHRGHPGDQVAVRAAPHRRPLCPRGHVHRRRPGHRGDLRAALGAGAAAFASRPA